jgi:3-(3-hydroxy-phenyl)propionate hydroxylase
MRYGDMRDGGPAYRFAHAGYDLGSDDMTIEDRRVLIAGGGPVGLLCAWLLGRHGLPVRLFDDNDSPQADPRAATTHPATLDLLAEDGLADDMARVGLVAPIFNSGTGLAAKGRGVRPCVLKDDTRHPFVVQCEQFKTAKLCWSDCASFRMSRLCTATRSSR